MEKFYDKANSDHRKNDTRRKIQYGGLVIKAGANREPKDVILGALLSIMEELDREPGTRELFKSKGMRALLKLDDQ